MAERQTISGLRVSVPIPIRREPEVLARQYTNGSGAVVGYTIHANVDGKDLAYPQGSCLSPGDYTDLYRELTAGRRKDNPLEIFQAPVASTPTTQPPPAPEAATAASG